MRKVFDQRVLVATLVAAFMLASACGGGSSTKTKAAGSSDASASSTTETTANDSSDSASSNASSSGGDVPSVVGQLFSQGTAHVDFSGAKDKSLDMKGTGVTSGGNTAITMVDEENKYAMTLAIAGKGDSGVSFQGPDVISGGAFGKECSIDVDDNNADTLSGSFTCTNLPAADPTSPRTAIKINAKGTFKLQK